MRLLDLIAQCREPLVLLPRDHEAAIAVSGPKDFSKELVDCPLRFVIADDLTRASAELAFADGDRLSDCLDLLRIPASSLWVEWNDAIHQQVICECGSVVQSDPRAVGRKVGVFLRSDAAGRSAVARTFWSAATVTGECEAEISPVETHINLDDRSGTTGDASRILCGEYVSVTDHREAGVADLLKCVRFKFDERWCRYYDVAAREPAVREEVVNRSLAAVAHDMPLLLAFFLLLNAKDATRRLPVHRGSLNRKRVLRNRALLLDHIEVHASLPGKETTDNNPESSFGARHSPRLHHVRGHIVRRQDRVFWRMPHLRGNASHGVVRSRTVCLSFARARD